MAKRMKQLGWLSICAMFIGCASTFKATYDHDANHDFSNYQTFAWISENPMKVAQTATTVNPLLQPRIMVSLESGLGAKGYLLVNEAEKADFVLSFTVGSREEIKVDSYPSMSAGYGAGYPGHWGWGGTYYGASYGTETSVRQYTKGMLAVDIFDVKERRPVWHGVASKTIHDSDRENVDATVQAAVDSILAGFPPT